LNLGTTSVPLVGCSGGLGNAPQPSFLRENSGSGAGSDVLYFLFALSTSPNRASRSSEVIASAQFQADS
jgi:hypothetical protein